jgi:malonyl-CoA O-methyltransferase
VSKVKVDDVAKAYDSWASVYDTDGNPLVALDDDIVPRLYLARISNASVLDVGCGTGRHTAFLSALAHDVVALDASAGMLAKARERLVRTERSGRVRFVQHHDLARLPFDDASFDVIVCALVLEHVEDLTQPIREMARVAKPGALVVVSDIHARMRERTQANFTDPATGDDVLPPSYPHEAEDYANAASAAGLTVVDVAEIKGTAVFAERVPRAKKYIDVPMLVVLTATKPVRT